MDSSGMQSKNSSKKSSVRVFRVTVEEDNGYNSRSHATPSSRSPGGKIVSATVAAAQRDRSRSSSNATSSKAKDSVGSKSKGPQHSSSVPRPASGGSNGTRSSQKPPASHKSCHSRCSGHLKVSSSPPHSKRGGSRGRQTSVPSPQDGSNSCRCSTCLCRSTNSSSPKGTTEKGSSGTKSSSRSTSHSSRLQESRGIFDCGNRGMANERSTPRSSCPTSSKPPRAVRSVNSSGTGAASEDSSNGSGFGKNAVVISAERRGVGVCVNCSGKKSVKVYIRTCNCDG